MANEIQATGSLTVARNGGAAVVSGSFSYTGTLVDEDMGADTQAFTTSATALTLCGVTSPGFIFVKNTSAAGNLHLYLDSGATQRLTTLAPGQAIPIPAPASMWGASSAGTVIAHVVAAKTA